MSSMACACCPLTTGLLDRLFCDSNVLVTDPSPLLLGNASG